MRLFLPVGRSQILYYVTPEGGGGNSCVTGTIGPGHSMFLAPGPRSCTCPLWMAPYKHSFTLRENSIKLFESGARLKRSAQSAN